MSSQPTNGTTLDPERFRERVRRALDEVALAAARQPRDEAGLDRAISGIRAALNTQPRPHRHKAFLLAFHQLTDQVRLATIDGSIGLSELVQRCLEALERNGAKPAQTS